jgi:esterase/lipase
MLHGAIGASDQLKPLSSSLNSQGFETFTFNFSGHGKTPFQTNFGIVQFAHELENFIVMNNLQGVPVFGYSMGGYVALYLAAQNKSLMGNIITLGTKLEWDPEGAAKEIKMLDAKTILEKVPKFAEALKTRHGNDWELLLKRTADMMIELGTNNLLNSETFVKIENKVLMGLADADNMVTVTETDRAASQIKNAKRFTLSNTKHPIETVNTEQLSNIIREFLAEARG